MKINPFVYDEGYISTGARKLYGEENPHSKLTESQVREICELIQSGKYFDTEIARMYDVSYTNITDIHNGTLWKQVSKDYDLSVKKNKGITREQAVEICQLLDKNELVISEISDITGVDIGIIQSIRERESWNDVSKDYNVQKPMSKKFTEKTIKNILKLLESKEMSALDISKKYDTTPIFLSNLKNGKTKWNYLLKDYKF